MADLSYAAQLFPDELKCFQERAMSYQLTEENIPEYLGTSQVLRAVFGDSGNLQVQNLAEGNINLIFRAFSRDDPIGRSVILKQALPHAHKYPDFKVPQERSKLEWEMLELENRYCPGLAPRVHHFDEGMYTIIMEDLNRHIIMRRGLMRQQVYPQFAGHIGIFLARTLFYTSDFFLDSAEKKSLVARFINPVMCRVTEDLVFTQPYISHSNNHWTPQLTEKVHRLQRDEQLRAEALLLKEQFMTRAQALIHGDLHTGSIMVNQTDTKVIDPEFGFFGPM
jgi:5-methylthioribose kinase